MDTQFPPFIKEAAETLVSMYESGLCSTNSVPVMEEIEDFAQLLDVAQCYSDRVGPSDSAVLLLEIIERRNLAVCPPGKRSGVLAVLADRCREFHVGSD